MTDPLRPHGLRVDHLVAPLGIGPDAPRLSWRLPDGAATQHAYRIVAGGWDSGRVESAESLFVPVDVPPASGRRVEWRVKTWTDLGESEWSVPGSWEHGLLHPSDWHARWIGPIEGDDLPARQRPAHQLAGSVRIDGEVAQARLYVTAHGIYEAFVNGARVGDLELTPGWTAYRSRLQVQTYDVTDLLTTGENVVGALLSDGWWRGQNSVSRRVDDYGATTALLAQLVVTLASGETVTFGTDPTTWRCTPSHVVARRPHRRRGPRPAGAGSTGGTGRPGPRSGSSITGTTSCARHRRRPSGASRSSLPGRSVRSHPDGGSSTWARTSTGGSGSGTSARPAPSSR